MFAAIAIVAALLPSTFEVSRETTIDRSPSHVYAMISDLEKWHPWDPWQTKESGLRLKVTESSSTGMKGVWLREDVAEGDITVTQTTRNERLDISIRRGSDPERALVFVLKDMGTKTRLQWTVSGENGMYPLGNLFALQMDSYIGPAYELALQKLKQHAETSSATP